MKREGDVAQQHDVENSYGWKDLPNELIIHSIIGIDVTVFCRLLCVDKSLQKWIQEVPFLSRGVIYGSLLKYNFPELYCTLHHLTYANELELLNSVARIETYRSLISDLFGYTVTQTFRFGNGRGMPLSEKEPYFMESQNIYHTNLDTIMATLSFQQTACAHLAGGPTVHFVKSMVQTKVDLDRGMAPPLSKEIAKKICRFYGALHPFGRPSGSYEMRSHSKRRSLLINIIRSSVEDARLIEFLNAVNVIIKANQKAIMLAIYGELCVYVDRVFWPIDVACDFDLDNCPGYTEITTERIFECWQTYMSPSFHSFPVTQSGTTTEGEDDFYYEGIDIHSFAARLTHITQSCGTADRNTGDFVFDALYELEKAVIRANEETIIPRIPHVGPPRQHGSAFGEILSLCRKVRLHLAKDKDSYGIEYCLYNNYDTYRIFRSFLYLALNKQGL